MTATLVDRFRARVAERPGCAAVRTVHGELSRQELDAASDGVARALLGAIGAEFAHVALLLDHGADTVAAILGVLKAGKAYVPLDPAQPAARLRLLLEDSVALALVTDPANAALARELAGEGVAVVVTGDTDAAAPGDGLPVVTAGDTPAYLLYTSGSTGRPKGVVQTHENVAHFADAYLGRLALTSDDRLSLLSSYCHDASIVDIFSALLGGACLCPVDLLHEGVHGAVRTMRELGVTVYHSVPSVYRRLLEGFGDRDAAAALRYVVLGGETVHGSDFRAYLERFPDTTRLVNLHGSTESSINAMFVADKQTRVLRPTVPVGTPVEDGAMLLLDEAGRAAEVLGEIAIRSRHVALGYWRQPEVTARAFSTDADGIPVYRTGDMGRRRPDGSLEFAGRKDHQVKIRGFRVEPSEVEAALAEHPAVREAAVVAWESDPMEMALAAYYVSRDVVGEGEPDLQSFLRARLPEYMVPAAFARLESMPVTVSGKVDRRALPSPVLSGRVDGNVAPRTPVEEALVAIWSDVLVRDSVGVHHNFFELGGHSLRAMQVLARIQETFQVELPVRSVFDRPTVAELALAVIEEMGLSGAQGATSG